ncbi:class Ib ribonucleoside-diphosphate reductase assembly flavoprotein NrdI [Luteococcus japonicus]|nr:class Ib ribonucleoside-diphosphate reductase assembly flavoprotein NrdI [Luteococcus japonicus]
MLVVPTYGGGEAGGAVPNVPLIDRFELKGTPDDVERVLERLTTSWPPPC